MPKVDVPSFYGGVSRQPTALRRVDQVEEADNVFFSVARGAEKRPATEWVTELLSPNHNPNLSLATHWIDRDASERYLLCSRFKAAEPLVIYNINTGDKIAVAYTNAQALAYVSVGRGSARFVTAQDTTFMLNRDQVVALKNGVNVSASSGTNVYKIEHATKVKSLEDDVSGAAYSNGDWIRVDQPPVYDANRPWLVDELDKGYYRKNSTAADWSHTSGTVRFERRWVDTVEDLPDKSFIRKGTPMWSLASFGEGQDDYCEVKKTSVGGPLGWYKSTWDATAGAYRDWERFPTPGQPNAYFDETTMPHQIVRKVATQEDVDAYNTDPTNSTDGMTIGTVGQYGVDEVGQIFFEVSQIDWTPRLTGDDDTNPPPSFVGDTISDIFIHRNRLGFASKENVILSESGGFFNFWLDDYTDLVDSDPIDISPASREVADVIYCIPFNETLVVFTKYARQFELRSDNRPLGPLSASLVPTTQYPSKESVIPQVSGRQLYFGVDTGVEPSVYEYSLLPDGTPSTAALKISEHCQGYLPANLTEIRVDEENTSLFYLTSDEPHILYTYKYYFLQNQKIQEAWSRQIFADSEKIQSIFVIEDYLYIFLIQSSRWRILRMSLKTRELLDTMRFEPLVDNRYYTASVGSFSSTTQLTTWIIPFVDSYLINHPEEAVVVLGEESDDDALDLRGVIREVVSVIQSGETMLIKVNGNYSVYKAFIGRRYEMSIELSSVYAKNPYTGRSLLDGYTSMAFLSISYKDSNFFKVLTQDAWGDERSQSFTAKYVSDVTMVLDTNPTLESGIFTAMIFGVPEKTKVFIKNNTPTPCIIASLSWDVSYNDRRS